MTHKYTIEGMTCNSCVTKVRTELLKTSDIEAVEMHPESPEAAITMRRHVPVNILQRAVTKAGNYVIREMDHSMETVIKPDVTMEASVGTDTPASYWPVFLIFIYLSGISLFAQMGRESFDLMQWMRHFMAGFFLVFSFFKLMNLKGFAEGYGTYDIVARKIPLWGYIYPFIELVLGLLYLTGSQIQGTTMATLIIMGIGSFGVIQSLLNKKVVQCACLGTVIKLPLSRVTLFEDLLMIFMSAIMLLSILH